MGRPYFTSGSIGIELFVGTGSGRLQGHQRHLTPGGEVGGYLGNSRLSSSSVM